MLGNGEVNFKGPKQFDLLVNTNIENVNIDFPKGFKTQGNATLSLSGSKVPFMLTGNYDIYGGLIESNFDSNGSSPSTDILEELLKKEISSPLIINLDITTLRPIEIRNSIIEGYLQGDLQLYDKISTPRIKGEAHFVDDSVVKLGDSEFEVTTSNFIFDGQSPINPKLTLRAKTRVNNYDIDMFLQGRASKPKLTVSSQPALPETQLISMLTLGQLPDQFDPNNNNPDQPQNSGFEIGTSLMSNNPLGKELKKLKKKGYDVDLQFSSSFDDNNEAVPKVTARYKISKKLQLSATVTTSNNAPNEGRMTYKLSDELSTIFRVTNQAEDINDASVTRINQQGDSIGIDLEYKVEYD